MGSFTFTFGWFPQLDISVQEHPIYTKGKKKECKGKKGEYLTKMYSLFVFQRDIFWAFQGKNFTFASTSGETSSSGDHNFPFFSPVDYRKLNKFNFIKNSVICLCLSHLIVVWWELHSIYKLLFRHHWDRHLMSLEITENHVET